MLLPYVPASTMDDEAPSAAAGAPVGVRGYTAGGSETISLPVYAAMATPGGPQYCLLSCADSGCSAAHDEQSVCVHVGATYYVSNMGMMPAMGDLIESRAGHDLDRT